MIKIIKKASDFILDIPITLYFNFYYLPINKAIKIPIRVSHNTILNNMGKRSSVKINSNNKTKIRIGKNASFSLGVNQKTYWDIDKDARIIFNENASIGRGTQIICSKNASIDFGNNFFCNANCIINSNGKLKFGNDIIIGWNTEILTAGGHSIVSIENQEEDNSINSITIGNHVWIASNVTILNNTFISDDSVVATKALVSKKFNENNIIIGKYNEILKRNILWKR